MSKLRSQRKELSSHVARGSSNIVYYRRGGLYWKVFVDFETKSSEEKLLRLTSDVDRYAVTAALSSSLWFWYYTVTSDCRHLGNRDINSFPFHTGSLSESEEQHLSALPRFW